MTLDVTSISNAHQPTIYFRNLMESYSSISATNENSEHPATNLANWQPWNYFEQASAGVSEISVDTGSANTTADYMCFYAHNLGDDIADGSVELLYSTDDVSYTQAALNTPLVSEKPQFKEFSTITARYWKIKITSNTSDPARIGVFSFGRKTIIKSGIPSGTLNPFYASHYERGSQSNNAGMLVDRVDRLRGIPFSLVFPEIGTTSLSGTNLQTFVDHASRKPFFYAWDPVGRLFDVLFCVARSIESPPYTSDITTQGTHTLTMQLEVWHK